MNIAWLPQLLVSIDEYRSLYGAPWSEQPYSADPAQQPNHPSSQLVGRESICSLIPAPRRDNTYVLDDEGFYDCTMGICPGGHKYMVDD